jgi:hypothetical protein
VTERDRLLAGLQIASEAERDAVLDVLAFITDRLDEAEPAGLAAIDPTGPLSDRATVEELLRDDW